MKSFKVMGTCLFHPTGIRGRSYGFGRFFDVRDEDLLTIKLDNIFIGRRKIFANLPRFQRRHPQRVRRSVEDLEVGRKIERGKKTSFKHEKPRVCKECVRPNGGNSHAEALRKNVGSSNIDTIRRVKLHLEENDLSSF